MLHSLLDNDYLSKGGPDNLAPPTGRDSRVKMVLCMSLTNGLLSCDLTLPLQDANFTYLGGKIFPKMNNTSGEFAAGRNRLG